MSVRSPDRLKKGQPCQGLQFPPLFAKERGPEGELTDHFQGGDIYGTSYNQT